MGSGWLLLLIPGVIWGASFLFIAEGLRSVGPNGVTFLRILAGFCTLALFPAARNTTIERRDWGMLAALGVTWFAFPLSMFPYAEQHVSSALTGMLNGANPLFATVVSALLARKMPASNILISLAIGILGTVLIAVPALGEGQSSAAGILMIMAALACYGLSLNLARPLQLKYGGMPVIWRAQMIGLILTAPLGLPEALHADWKLWPALSILALGSLGTAVAYVVMAAAAGRFGAARASGATFLIPVVALALGVLLRNEQVAGLSVFGSALSLLGAWMMKRASATALPPVSRSPAG